MGTVDFDEFETGVQGAPRRVAELSDEFVNGLRLQRFHLALDGGAG